MNQPDRIADAFACLRKTDAPIDDLHSARVWSDIDARLRERRSRSWWVRFAIPLAASGSLCLCLATWLVSRHLGRPSGALVAVPSPKASLRAQATGLAHPDSISVIAPYLVSGPAPSQLLDGRHSHLEIPLGGLLRATVADQARITLLGPAELTVLSADREAIVLSLHHGVLLCDYQHRGGRSLRVRSPGAETVVVGTLFSVEATGAGTTVAVARGTVDVVAHGRTLQVGEGRRLLPTDEVPQALAGVAAERLAEHEAAVPPPQGEAGVLSVVAETKGGPIWLAGRLLGTPPLAVRLPSGPTTLLVGGRGVLDSAIGNSRVRRIETLILPGKTAVALVDGSRPSRPGDAPMPGLGGTSPHSRQSSPLAAAEVPSQEALPSDAPSPATPERDGAEETAAMAYQRAEAAMKKGDNALARRTLRALVARFPDGEFASPARYEIARMAFATGDWQSAQREIEELRKTPLASVLAEPVQYLGCRVEMASGHRARALACLADFRASFPGSPHDAEVLALLASFRFDETCASALPLLDEYLRRYPQGAFAKDAERRRQHCPP